MFTWASLHETIGSNVGDVYTFRRAEPVSSDAGALLRVEQQSLGDSPYDAAEILDALRLPEHYAYLALDGQTAVGFCSCLQTPAQGIRLEIDMLGVLPEHRGRGLATRLIQLAMVEARARGVHHFRGVVSEGNLASQRAFGRAGLKAPSKPVALMVYDVLGYQPSPFLPTDWTWQMEGIRTGDALPSEELHRLLDGRSKLKATASCLLVSTLSYRGIWVESLHAASGALKVLLRALVERAKTMDMDQVGYLAPLGPGGEPELLHTWLRQGYRIQGRYVLFTAELPDEA